MTLDRTQGAAGARQDAATGAAEPRAFGDASLHLSKAGAAYVRLKDLLLAGRLPPEQRLLPADLAATLGLSLTPVREALIRLELEGFVRKGANRGYFVPPLSLEAQAQGHEWLALNLYVALFAVSPIQPAEVVRLRDWLRDAADGDPGPEAGADWLARHDEAWGRVVARLRNAQHLRSVRLALDQTRIVRSLDAEAPERRRRLAAAEATLCDAALADDLQAGLAAYRRLKDEAQTALPRLVEAANLWLRRRSTARSA